MKTLEQLGISPTPWKQGERIPFCEDHIVSCDYHRANGTTSTRLVADCNSAYDHEQARIDAQLIAAAPELYEALCEAVSDKCVGCCRRIDDENGNCATLCIAGSWRAALAKAAGESETISQPDRGARRNAETTEAKDPTHSAVRKG